MTIIEAPSGFGKTTAVREYLYRYHSKTAYHYWYTVLGEPEDKSWQNIFRLFENIDAITSERLLNIGMPNLENLPDIAEVIRNIDCNCETFFVIDNFQMMKNDVTREMLKVFSIHGCENLHLIIITQQIDAENYSIVNNNCIHSVDSECFFFNKNDIMAYYKSAGISITPNQLDKVFKRTEGWVAALYLQMLSYIETGSFENATGINKLIEVAIWNRLSKREQEFLLSLSVFDSFSVKQAQTMLGISVMPKYAQKILDNNTFISFDNNTTSFYIHSILKNFLRAIFEHMDQKFKDDVYYRAGLSYKKIDQYYAAIRYFYYAGDFESILSLELVSSDLTSDEEKEVGELILEILSRCPEDLLDRYPRTLIVFALEAFVLGKYDEFKQICNKIATILQRSENFDQEYYTRLCGELCFLTSFLDFNDIDKMCCKFKAAYELLADYSDLISRNDSWTFGTTSVVYLLHSESGNLAEEVKALEECLPYYHKLTNGHGSGADAAFRAEALFNRGDISAAETLCHKAIYLANNKNQDSIVLTATLILARIAILKGDVNYYQIAIDNINRYTVNGKELRLKYTSGLCKSFLNISLDITAELPDWFLDNNNRISAYLYDVAIPYAFLIYGRYLLINKEYHKFLGFSAPILESAEWHNFILAKIYILIYIAIANNCTNNYGEAEKALSEALSLALPDKLYLPFAENGKQLKELLLKLSPDITDKDGLNQIFVLSDAYGNGADIIKDYINYQTPSLTTREREIAELVKLGFTTKEIAEKLFVSSETIKTTLKKIFKKLNVKSRVELKNMEI